MILKINGHDLNVEFYGSEGQQAVVLLHHGIGSINAWQKQIPPLIESGYQVLAYDRWGYGLSGKRSKFSPPDFEADLLDLLALLKHFDMSPVTLVGHSDGGTIALEFTSLYPVHVAGIISVASHIYVESKMLSGIDGIRQAYYGRKGFRRALQKEHGAKTDWIFNAWYDGWREPQNLDWDLRPRLNEIRCPALIVQGIDDEHATPKHAEDLAASLEKAELWLEPGVGHMFPQDVANCFNARMLQFLSAIRLNV